MGSDLYMEQQNWRARPHKAEWDGDELVISADRFYVGYEAIWRGTPTSAETWSAIYAMVPKDKIPPKPSTDVEVTVTFTKEEYEQLKTNALWETGGGVAAYLRKAAFGNTRKGC